MTMPRADRITLRSRSLIAVLPVLVLLTVALAPAMLAQPASGAGEVIAMRELQLREGVNLAEFERFVAERYNPSWQGAVPGMRGYIAKGDRGARKGSYALIFIFDSEKVRNTIFPKEGGGPSENFTARLEKPFSLAKDLEQYVEPGVIGVYTDYVVLR